MFPVGIDKRPLTSHGRNDATIDLDVVTSYWRRHPKALVGVATGRESGLVVLDIDVRDDYSGFDALEELGRLLPHTPIAHSPSGGVHLWFGHPGGYVKTIAGKLGRGLDIRGDGGSIIAPPGPGRYWDPACGFDTAMLRMPEWMIIRDEPPSAAIGMSPPQSGGQALSRYGEAALDSAVDAIRHAPAGQQEETLNREAFAIGGLVAGGSIPAGLAADALRWAAGQMPSYDPRRPWKPGDLTRKVEAALVAGMRHPRKPAA